MHLQPPLISGGREVSGPEPDLVCSQEHDSLRFHRKRGERVRQQVRKDAEAG
jgi:hypothetical protein